jgi:3-hydroxy-5-phosphonooxypentane-2,4-dione thiolase
MANATHVPEAKGVETEGCLEKRGFFVKGAESLDWGMKNRLARIFSPQSRNTVMMAIDHGYFEGPISGLERVVGLATV